MLLTVHIVPLLIAILAELAITKIQMAIVWNYAIMMTQIVYNVTMVIKVTVMYVRVDIMLILMENVQYCVPTKIQTVYYVILIIDPFANNVTMGSKKISIIGVFNLANKLIRIVLLAVMMIFSCANNVSMVSLLRTIIVFKITVNLSMIMLCCVLNRTLNKLLLVKGVIYYKMVNV